MRIALFTYSTRPRGGVVHTLALAEALARAGQDVTVWTLARGGDTTFFRPVDPAVQVRAVEFPDREETVGERVLRSISVLGRAFREDPTGYDVVHAQDCISANAAGRGIRTVHHVDHFTTPQLAACHERAIVEPVAHVTVSAAVAAELKEGWGLDATVIPNGVDAARFAAAADAGAGAEWRARYGNYVLAVGGIEPRKGTLDLVTAMAAVQRERDAVLVAAGGETLFDHREYRRAVDERVAELGVRLELLGPVDDPVLPGLVAGAGVFAFPSVQEGFGLAAMEALAARVPVVVRDLPVLHEVFGSAVRYAGTPADLAAKLLRGLAGATGVDPAPGAALAAAHTWDGAAGAHLELYRRLAAAGVRVGRPTGEA